MTLRFHIALALAFVLVLTGQSMALARTMPGPAGSVVLCTGTGPVTVMVDESGTPMGPVHICPDCTIALFAATLPDMPDLPRPVSHSMTLQATAPQVLSGHGGLFLARARAPPLRD